MTSALPGTVLATTLLIGDRIPTGCRATSARCWAPMRMDLPWWLPLGHVPEVSPRDLAAALERDVGVQLVDVRSPTEFQRGHLRGAVNLPITSFRHGLAALGLQPARPVVAICLSAHRSIPAVRILRQQGFEARHLAGGMLAWRAAGLPEVAR